MHTFFKLSDKDNDQQSVSAGNCVDLGFCFNLSYGKGIMSLFRAIGTKLFLHREARYVG